MDGAHFVAEDSSAPSRRGGEMKRDINHESTKDTKYVLLGTFVIFVFFVVSTHFAM